MKKELRRNGSGGSGSGSGRGSGEGMFDGGMPAPNSSYPQSFAESGQGFGNNGPRGFERHHVEPTSFLDGPQSFIRPGMVIGASPYSGEAAEQGGDWPLYTAPPSAGAGAGGAQHGEVFTGGPRAQADGVSSGGLGGNTFEPQGAVGPRRGHGVGAGNGEGPGGRMSPVPPMPAINSAEDAAVAELVMGLKNRRSSVDENDTSDAAGGGGGSGSDAGGGGSGDGGDGGDGVDASNQTAGSNEISI